MKDSHQNKQDCELFLRAFEMNMYFFSAPHLEEPTQIYRYLRTRRLLSPLFLQRNLSYLSDRSTKRKFSRRSSLRKANKFDWDTFLKHLKPVQSHDPIDSSLVFKFLGYFDKDVSDTDTANIDIHLLSRNKHQPKLLLKSIPVEINPSLIINPAPITISKDQLMRNASKTDQSCELLIEVSYVEQQNGQNNERSQRSKKRRKVCHDAHLPVFNKMGRCDLLEGEYELKLDFSTESSRVRKVDQLAWATDIPKVLTGDMRYFQNRSLKFLLQWNDGSKSKSSSPIHNENGALATDTTDWCGIRTGSTTSLSTSSGILSDMSSDDAEVTAITTTVTTSSSSSSSSSSLSASSKAITKKLPTTLPSILSNRSPFVELLNIGSHLIYRFIYNDDLSQKTDAWDEFLCPWCYLNCVSLHPLLMHLRLCHDRFKFSYTVKEDGIQVDVSINERYNCALSPLKEQSRQSKSDVDKPSKRKPYTKVLVSRQRAKKRRACLRYEDLDEAFESDIDSSDAEENKFILPKGQLSFDGHDRGYFRTINNMPYTHRIDFDEDSEGEHDPGWLRQHTKKLLDDFSDVNEGEKAMLVMWNWHVMKHNFVGVLQMPLACEMFVRDRGDEIWKRKLYNNFLLHLTNLHDYDMLSAGQMHEIIQKMQKKKHGESSESSEPHQLNGNGTEK